MICRVRGAYYYPDPPRVPALLLDLCPEVGYTFAPFWSTSDLKAIRQLHYHPNIHLQVK